MSTTSRARMSGVLGHACRYMSHARLSPRPDDVVLTFVKRTPLTRAKKGLLSQTASDQLLRLTLQEGIRSSRLDPALVQDIVVGTCHPPSPCYESRAAALAAGFPQSVPVQSVNRLCGSGLMAIRHISDSIRAGDIDVGVAVGYESMSSHPRPTPVFADEEILGNTEATDCAKPMGWTSEMLAIDYNVSRGKQDEYGLLSHRRARRAQAAGTFADEIMPITTTFQPDLPDATRDAVTVTEDDGPRDLTEEKMRQAKPAFKGMGDERSTGPNSSQVTDGAAMGILMSRRRAEELGQPILATHLGTMVVGVSPRVMGIGPVAAIPRLLERSGLRKEDVDLFEINEAFGSMYAYSVETLGLDIERVNVNGGAIALGHPLGATGVRQVATGVAELQRRKAATGKGGLLCTSMCIGSGMGAAALFAV